MISDDLAAAAVRTGKLKGLVQQTGQTLTQPTRPDLDVTLKETSSNITRFLASSNLDEVFDRQMNGFYRVKTTDK